MTWMNEYEVEDALRRWSPGETPNLAAGAQILDSLRGWANRNSDGWVYWPKPSRAAASLQTLLQAGEARERNRYTNGEQPRDATAAELKKALSPIKAFLTRQGVDHDLVLGGTR